MFRVSLAIVAGWTVIIVIAYSGSTGIDVTVDVFIRVMGRDPAAFAVVTLRAPAPVTVFELADSG
jgi:hypothetical protein